MLDPKTNKPRMHGTTLSLENLLRSFLLPSPASADSPSLEIPQQPQQLPNCAMHNAGNDALMTLFALQMLLEPQDIVFPTMKKGRIGRPGGANVENPMVRINALRPIVTGSDSTAMNGNYFSGYATVPSLPVSGYQSPYDLSGEFGQMQVRRSSSRSPALQLGGGGGAGRGQNNLYSRKVSTVRTGDGRSNMRRG